MKKECREGLRVIAQWLCAGIFQSQVLGSILAGWKLVFLIPSSSLSCSMSMTRSTKNSNVHGKWYIMYIGLIIHSTPYDNDNIVDLRREETGDYLKPPPPPRVAGLLSGGGRGTAYAMSGL